MTTHREITAILHRAMGFDAASLSRTAVERALRKRLAECKQSDEGAYLAQLQASPLELACLIEEIVVPETWFFRDGKPFDALKRYAMEEWLPVNPERDFRVLSVPCSSGEEPYSAVMALLDGGFPAERLSVEGVDISNVALAKARRGIYGRNSFRGGYAGLQERYFSPCPQGWLLNAQVRDLVGFSQGNLLAADFSLLRGAYDAIFCRNLLIYFDDNNREVALSALDRMLLPQGILFVGHAESAPVVAKYFTAVLSEQAFAYRKKSPRPLDFGAAQDAASRTGRHRVLVPGAAGTPREPAARQTAKPAAAVPAVDVLDQARRLADQGKLAEAALQCELALRQQGASAQAYYLLGLVHGAGNDSDHAREFFGKAVYLEPDHYEALVQLALLADRAGEDGQAALLRQRAQRAAAKRGVK